MNSMEEQNTFTIVDEDGQEHVAVIVYQVDPEEEGNTFGKTFLLYYLEDEEENEEVMVYSAVIDPNAPEGELGEIESEEEYAYIEAILNNLEENAAE